MKKHKRGPNKRLIYNTRLAQLQRDAKPPLAVFEQYIRALISSLKGDK